MLEDKLYQLEETIDIDVSENGVRLENLMRTINRFGFKIKNVLYLKDYYLFDIERDISLITKHEKELSKLNFFIDLEGIIYPL